MIVWYVLLFAAIYLRHVPWVCVQAAIFFSANWTKFKSNKLITFQRLDINLIIFFRLVCANINMAHYLKTKTISIFWHIASFSLKHQKLLMVCNIISVLEILQKKGETVSIVAV